MYIYILTEYEYTTFSYSGIEPHRSTYFSSKEGAEKYAIQKKLKVVSSIRNADTECTIDKEVLLDE